MTYQVGIVGSGNWGSTISKVVGQNLQNLPGYATNLYMWVMEEVYEGEKLSHLINTRHENPKYLPGIQLPHNVIAETDLIEVVKKCTHLIFVLPHQFVLSTCDKVKNSIKEGCIGISLIKGLMDSDNSILLSSELIHQKLGIHMSVLSGANIANEIAAEKLSTTTLGSDNVEYAAQWKALLSKPYFILTLVPFTKPLEILGAVKNCIALGIGFLEALGYGANAKASAIRIGFIECFRFVTLFEQNCPIEMLLESFGLDDLIATCIGGRNVRAAEAFIRTNKTIKEIEKELLNGQMLQGPSTIKTVHNILVQLKKQKEFPFLLYIYNVLYENACAGSIHEIFNI